VQARRPAPPTVEAKKIPTAPGVVGIACMRHLLVRAAGKAATRSRTGSAAAVAALPS